MINLRSKSRLMFLAAFAAVAAAASALFYVFPYAVFTDIQSSLAAVRSARGQLRFLELSEKQARANEKVLAKEAALIDALHRVFIDPGSPLPFLEMVENLARDAGLFISIDLSSAGAENPAFSVTVVGGREKVFIFLRKLEAAPIVARLGRVSVQKVGSEEASSLRAKNKLPSAPELKLTLAVRGLTR